MANKNELEDYRAESVNLRTKYQALSDERTIFVEKIQSLEYQLCNSIEKNKACQNEVAQRDQQLIKLQSDLNLISEKYSSSLDELKIQEEELERLNSRVKKQSNDMKDMQALNDKLDDRSNNLEKQLKQSLYDNEMYKQEILNNEKHIENLKAEWTNNIRNHEEEIKGYKQNYQILNEELTHTKSELNDFMNKIQILKQKMNDLNMDLEEKCKQNESLTSDLNKYEFICKEQEAKIGQQSTDLAMFKSQTEIASQQINQMNYKLNEAENKNQQLIKNIDHLEHNANCLNEIIMELKFKVRIHRILFFPPVI